MKVEERITEIKKELGKDLFEQCGSQYQYEIITNGEEFFSIESENGEYSTAYKCINENIAYVVESNPEKVNFCKCYLVVDDDYEFLGYVEGTQDVFFVMK